MLKNLRPTLNIYLIRTFHFKFNEQLQLLQLSNISHHSSQKYVKIRGYGKSGLLDCNHQFKLIHVLPNHQAAFSTSSVVSNFNHEWTKILANAEKVVGYPTSFLNLRYLVSDEVANFANLLRKLIKTKHPLIKMARSLVSGDGDGETNRSSLQINGLIVLLISKAAGVPQKSSFVDVEISDGIHKSQRSLAEISEMIYMGSLIHKGIVDLGQFSAAEHTSMDQGNKLAVLCGDYLLANACNNLSKLQNTEVVDLMSQVIADISQSMFIYNLNSKLSFLKIWYERVNSNSSSLLANSAKSALLLVKHSPKLQDIAWNFAKNLDITYKIWSDLIDFKKDTSLINKSETIVNAIYKDNYEKDNTLEYDSEETSVGKQRKVVLNQNQTTISVASSSSAYSSFLSTFYPSSYLKTNNQLIDEILQEKIIQDCRVLFENHYNITMARLNELENEHSEKEAIASLRSMLNVMNSSV